jgi:hypothetical protein
MGAALAMACALVGCSDEGSGEGDGGSGTVGPEGPANPVQFQHPGANLYLTADDFRVVADGETFVGVEPVEIDDNQGHTIELKWNEHGAEMRVYIYAASDGTDWYVDEIRIYDGVPNDSEWVYYEGQEYFRAPLGQPDRGEVLTLEGGAGDPGRSASLYLRNYEVLAYDESQQTP